MQSSSDMLCHEECSYHSPRSIKLHLTSAGRALVLEVYTLRMSACSSSCQRSSPSPSVIQ
ncbi:hypothetical protein CY34DRAFT_708235 [Suillus luteus UH-Slu-Lm8-n1]|uniref:Uncharacterized protein n=1 Tax=Suillus luteus UH-Slu-Lm8-n1 TaxID=930992 RepID=A0A0D0BB85_9AGAM|nr:hypothetical protein CY34DRAFT_708235 [Suillus luteus UH-Slu-Lm8-n1]